MIKTKQLINKLVLAVLLLCMALTGSLIFTGFILSSLPPHAITGHRFLLTSQIPLEIKKRIGSSPSLYIIILHTLYTGDIHFTMYNSIHKIMFITLSEQFKQFFLMKFWLYTVFAWCADFRNESSSNFLFYCNTYNTDGLIWTHPKKKMVKLSVCSQFSILLTKFEFLFLKPKTSMFKQYKQK